MNKKYFWLLLLAAGTVLPGCPANDDKSKTNDTVRQEASLPQVVPVDTITPVNLPDPGITGFSFPDTVDIDNWVQQQDSASINLHGWGLWVALNMPTTQNYKGDTLRVYQTWQTKVMLLSQMSSTSAALTAPASVSPRLLNSPRQFRRDPLKQKLRSVAMAHATATGGVNSVREQVCYNPSAATSILSGKLFLASTLQQRINQGQADLPDFGTDAISIKPMYEVIPGPKAPTPGLFNMKVWTGPAPASPADSLGYDQPQWPSSVYVDINNHGQGKGAVSTNGAPATPATTYNLRDFVYFTLDSAEAQLMKANPGDYAVLVGMHITTNEIANWTWQTMWWSPSPNTAYAPSSAGVLAARPQQLKGAPAHYAMSIAYQMMTPAQPTFSAAGIPQGTSRYAYNPYLEAPFTYSTFPTGALRSLSQVQTNGMLVTNNYGIRTNCMSCHQMAAYSPTTPTYYLGDTYVDLNSKRFKPLFKGQVRTDFLWSVANLGQ